MSKEQNRAYLVALLVAALAGLPIAAVAVAFDSVVHGLTTLFWTDIPKDLLDVSEPPWWYVLLLPTFAGLLTAGALRLPGHGGHSPADGLSLAPLPPRLAAGGILAAAAALVFGIVLGPEAPLVAIGLALGTVAGRLARQNQVITSIITFAGGFAAISTVFGGPLTSSLLLFEAVATSGKFPSAMLPRFLLPGLLAAGVGQLVFTGVAGWSGVHETALDLPNLPHYGSVRVVDIPLSILVALVVAAIVIAARRVGSIGFHRVGGRLPVLLAGGFSVGLIAWIFHEAADRPLSLVLFSGEAATPKLLAETSAAVLVGVVVAKALAYAISIGAGFRGGPVFPAVFLGAAMGVLASVTFGGYSITAAVAVGVAAATAAGLRTPFTGALLASLLVGSAGANAIPLTIISAVVAWLAAMAVAGRQGDQPATPTEPPPDGPSGQGAPPPPQDPSGRDPQPNRA
jgi:H+/Cl- antiporter ClcA